MLPPAIEVVDSVSDLGKLERRFKIADDPSGVKLNGHPSRATTLGIYP
jgi:hypothetical protein